MDAERKFYEAEEDSQILLESVFSEYEDLKNKEVLEVGVGSGYILNGLANKFPKNTFYGVDINEVAIEETRKKLDTLDIEFKLVTSNLFEHLEGKFDIILFNPPYLPLEEGEEFERLNDYDKALYGGKKGYEVILKFLEGMNDHLSNDGVCFLIVSSLSKLEVIESYMEENLIDYKIIKEKNFFFETLYCLKIEKSQVLKSINEQNIKSIKYLSSGKHSKVVEGVFEDINVIVKIGKSQHIDKEDYFMKKLKDEFFVPRYVLFNRVDGKISYLVREKLEGELIGEFIEKKDREDVIVVLNKIFEITNRLDKLNINKFEMINPYKHIFIKEINSDFKVSFIDFERCIFSENPKNTRQFLEYVRRHINTLKEKGVNINEEKIFSISKSLKVKITKVEIEDLI